MIFGYFENSITVLEQGKAQKGLSEKQTAQSRLPNPYTCREKVNDYSLNNRRRALQ